MKAFYILPLVFIIGCLSNPPEIAIETQYSWPTFSPSYFLNGEYYGMNKIYNLNSGSYSSYFPVGECSNQKLYFITQSQNFLCLDVQKDQVTFNSFDPKTKKLLQNYTYRGNDISNFQIQDDYVIMLPEASSGNITTLAISVYDSIANSIVCSIPEMNFTNSTKIAGILFTGDSIIFGSIIDQQLILNYLNCIDLSLVSTNLSSNVIFSNMAPLNDSSVIALFFTDSTTNTSKIRAISYNSLGQLSFGPEASISENVYILNGNSIIEQDQSSFSLYVITPQLAIIKSGNFSLNYPANTYDYVLPIWGSEQLWISFDQKNFFIYDFSLSRITNVTGYMSPFILANGSEAILSSQGVFVGSYEAGYYFTPVIINSFYQNNSNPNNFYGFYTPSGSQPVNCTLLEIVGSSSTVLITTFSTCPSPALIGNPLLDVVMNEVNSPTIAYRDVTDQLNILSPDNTVGPFILTQRMIQSTVAINLTSQEGFVVGTGVATFNLSSFGLGNGNVNFTKQLSGSLYEFVQKLTQRYFLLVSSNLKGSTYIVYDSLDDLTVKTVSTKVVLPVKLQGMPFISLVDTNSTDLVWSGIVIQSNSTVFKVMNSEGELAEFSMSPYSILNLQPLNSTCFYVNLQHDNVVNVTRVYQITNWGNAKKGIRLESS